jgi:DNA/RNA endonuclease G (NUC1)
MLVVQMLMPRFLVVEVVLFIHIVLGQSCVSSGLKKATGGLFDDGNSDSGDSTTPSNSANLCLIPLGNGTIRWEPLFLSVSGDYLMPNLHQKRSQIEIRGQATVSCPSARLSLLGDGNENVIDIICFPSGRLHTKENGLIQAMPEDLSCSRSIRETLMGTNDKCGPSDYEGRLVHIGWKTRGLFTPQLSVCHDKHLEHTYFTNHSILGSHIDAKNIDSTRPNFKEGGRGFYSRSSASNAYKKASQESKILSQYDNRLDSNMFLARGHLSPDADFIYKEWQDATYYFMNAAPQWQPFNNGNWVAVENAVRELARKRGRTLRVQTGTHDVLQLENGSGDSIYLGDHSTIAVPLYFWKVVHDVSTNEAIVFVTINKPNIEESDEIPTGLNLCGHDPSSLCEESGWNFRHRKKSSKGILYCCTYTSLKLTLPWIMDLTNPGLLTAKENTQY